MGPSYVNHRNGGKSCLADTIGGAYRPKQLYFQSCIENVTVDEHNKGGRIGSCHGLGLRATLKSPHLHVSSYDVMSSKVRD